MSSGDHLIRILKARPELADTAVILCEFEVEQPPDHVEEVWMADGSKPEPLSTDFTGGTFFRCPDGALLYGSSEGAAALVGTTVAEGLETMFNLPPYWQDALSAVRGSENDEDLAARLAESEAEAVEEYPDLPERRRQLLEGLGLGRLAPVEAARRLAHAAVNTEPGWLLLGSDDRNVYSPLQPGLPQPGLWNGLLDGIPDDPDGPTRLRIAQEAHRRGDLALAHCLLLHLCMEEGMKDFIAARPGTHSNRDGNVLPPDRRLCADLAEELDAVGNTWHAAKARALARG
jgi:hypothetical protein